MDVHDGPRWLTYKQAAARVKRTPRSIRGWHAAGMPMRMVDGEQLVEETVLLAWFRDRLNASPSEHYRRRARARAAGLPDPEAPPSVHAARRRPATAPAEPVDDDPADVDPWERPPAPKIPDLTRGAEEFARLQRALKIVRTPCADDARFTADKIPGSDLAVMAWMCDDCAVYALCEAFRDAARPVGGFWAGRAA